MPFTAAGNHAERRARTQTKFGGSYRYTVWSWVVLENEKFRRATASEAKALNRDYGSSPGYGGPNHPSYRPY